MRCVQCQQWAADSTVYIPGASISGSGSASAMWTAAHSSTAAAGVPVLVGGPGTKAFSAGLVAVDGLINVSRDWTTVCKAAGVVAVGEAAAGLSRRAVAAALLKGRMTVLAGLGSSSNPGASSAARSSELAGEGGGEGPGVVLTPLLGLPLRGGAVAPMGPCLDGSSVTVGEAAWAAGMGPSLRGLPLGLAAFAAAAMAAASAAASAGVLHNSTVLEGHKHMFKSFARS